MSAPKQPPPPPSSAPPVPRGTRARIEMADAALRLRDEQLRARVIYVDPSLKTNAELDAITEQVVAELRQMQSAGLRDTGELDAQQVEIELIKSLRECLEKMLSPRREHFLKHKIELIQRRITNLFFSSEMGASSEAPRPRAIYTHGDEALFHVLRRHEPAILAEIEALPVRDRAVTADAVDRYKLFGKQLLGQVLARSMPDLERLLVIYRDVLYQVLVHDLASQLGEFAWEVIREARVAHGNELSYKIGERAFPQFRQVFERRFLEHLLAQLQGPLAEKMGSSFRDETRRFAADPRIYAEICAVMCNAIYDFLHGEGFLDLPVDWQKELAKQP